MAPSGASGAAYSTQVGALWSGLASTLGQLERLAADPLHLEDEETVAVLRRHQYRLHLASEAAFGLAPPTGVEPVHGEIAAALAGARDATAEMVDALESGGIEAALLCVHEWRGALFRVRLARLRLAPPAAPAPAPAAAEHRRFVAPLVALLLVLAGTVVFVAGAVDATWPLWAAGLLALAGALITYKP